MTRARIAAAVFGGLLAVVMIVVVAGAPSWWRERLADPTPLGAPMPADPTAPVASPADRQALADVLGAAAATARGRGAGAGTIERAIAGVTRDEEILRLAAEQPEIVRAVGDYMALLVSETRIANGRARLADATIPFAAIEARYGVDRHVLAAIWGIESAYGTALGERSVVRSLATLAATDERRKGFWQGELAAALTILANGDVSPEAMRGSWAGAMGHTQFMPSTYLAHAVDFDGDGRRDIWTSPVDALASAANYLVTSGWVPGEPVAVEVQLPPGFDLTRAMPETARAFAAWRSTGVTAIDATRADAKGGWSLLLPAGHAGPAFLVGANFASVLRYNRSTSYALAVSHLADRLAGLAPLAQAWPAGDRALSRLEREDLQRSLAHLGHDVGPVDGIIGTATRAALRVFQAARGLPADGHPDAVTRAALRIAVDETRRGRP